MFFENMIETDRIDHEKKKVYCGTGTSGVPPVCTARWDREAWEKYDKSVSRARALEAECVEAGYRFIGLG